MLRGEMSSGHAIADPSAVVEVYPFDLDSEETIPLELARGWLSVGEWERARRFRFEIHRDRYVRGRGVMRGLLGQRLDRDPTGLRLGEGSRGKPSLVDDPTGFNLSHSEGLAVFALGSVSGLGVDIERYDRRVDHAGLGRRCFRETEISWVEGFGPEGRHLGFFRVWTAKEARMKATGEGFQLAPQRIALDFSGERPVRVLEPEEPASMLESLDLFGGEAACAVVALAPFRVRVHELPEWG